LHLYRCHRRDCVAGRPYDSRSGESDEHRKGWQRCGCRIRKTLTDSPQTAIGSQEHVRPVRTGVVNSSSTDYADVSWNVPPQV